MKRGDRETSEERGREQMSEVGEGKWEEEKEVGGRGDRRIGSEGNDERR